MKGREFQSADPMCWKDLSHRVLLPILGTFGTMTTDWSSCTTKNEYHLRQQEECAFVQLKNCDNLHVIWTNCDWYLGHPCQHRSQVLSMQCSSWSPAWFATELSETNKTNLYIQMSLSLFFSLSLSLCLSLSLASVCVVKLIRYKQKWEGQGLWCVLPAELNKTN